MEPKYLFIITILIAVVLDLVWVTKKPAMQTKPENVSLTPDTKALGTIWKVR